MPRAGLSTEVVVAEAARLADEVGWERLTLAAVAARLGVRLPSLYKHVAGLDALRVQLATAACVDLGAELSAVTVGRSGLDALVVLAETYRSFASRRPGAYAAALRAPDPDNLAHVAAATALLQVALSVLAGFGLEDDDCIDAIRGLRALMHGFVAIEAADGFRMAQDLDRSYLRLVGTFGDALVMWSAATRAAEAP